MAAWASLDLWQDLVGYPVTQFSSATGPVGFTTDLDNTWVEVGLGADLLVQDSWRVYGSVGYDVTLDGDTDAIEGVVGFKYTW